MSGKYSSVATIGHSNVPIDKFIGLLKTANIKTVIDCRSKPRSRFAQFNGNRLAEYLLDEGVIYEFRGNNLGGLYENVNFDKTLDEIAQRAKTGEHIALLCSEGRPEDCHRSTLLAPELVNRDISIKHLLYDKSRPK